MTLFMLAALAVMLAWILRPSFTPRRELDEGSEEVERLVEMKQAIYRSIIDLEHDAALGKVSDEDHRAIKQQHEAEAIEILNELEAQGDEALRLRLESEIAEARDRMKRG